MCGSGKLTIPLPRPVNIRTCRIGMRTALIVAAVLAIGVTLPQAARAQHSGGRHAGGGSHSGGGSWHGGSNWHGGGGSWRSGRSGGSGWHRRSGGWWWAPAAVAGLYAGAALASPYSYGYGYPYYGYTYPYASYAYPYGYPNQSMAYAPTAPTVSYWYYCQNPAGYYPYIQQCSTQWQPVPAG